ncbi:MAG: 2-C-methyl-D-erythritol 2,4-cyclodiphosphate synthase, partial [Clostridia bacterium]|nr:2-C-methyl-D-erythritol 2,4-cyclodiphosphate synthase [Clostridia bacterium]
LLHAEMDAVLGALAIGDIGKHFHYTDEAFRCASSMGLEARVAAHMKGAGYRIGNVDVTVIAQRPKLAPFIPEMVKNIAAVFSCDSSCVNVKATTEEGLGFTGNGEGIAAHAVCICMKNK